MSPSAPASPPQSVHPSVHPLRIRNFRLLWLGEGISLLGDQFYLIALPWLVLELTGSALALGTVMALVSIPRAIFMVVGGAVIDRFSPRAAMLASNFARMILVALLALLILTNQIQLWMLYAFALLFGTADAFYFPAQTAIIPQLLQGDQLQVGNSFIQGTATMSMIAGPFLAGVLIVVLNGSSASGDATPGLQGIGIAFALDALSFVASLITLRLVRVEKRQAVTAESASVLSSIKEGMAYIWGSSVLRMMFFQLFAINLFTTGPLDVGIPLLANRNLVEGAAAFGILMSAHGGGSLIGIILGGTLPRPRPSRFGLALLGMMAILGIGMVLLPLSTSTPVVALIMLVMGIANGYAGIQFVTWQQRRIPEQLMGRVMSLLLFTSIGIAPVSSTLAGVLLNLSPNAVFIGAGVLLTTLMLYFATLPMTRQIGLEVEAIEKQKALAEATNTM